MFVTGTPFPFSLVAQRIFAGIDSFAILAIPLFVLAGELMNASGITNRIITFANALVGHLRAGLAQVNIWSSVVFAGLSGSAVADTSALGRVFIPSMEKEGYPRGFAAALTAASSVIGPLIPPSIPVIIYALIAGGMSIPAMFLAGITPGVLLAVALSIFAMVVILNLMIGLTTPPMGLCLFVANSIANVGMGRLVRFIMPMFLAQLVVLLLVTFVPGLVTRLPRLLGF